MFKKSWDDVGKRIEQTQNAYETMSGTRARQLDRRLAAVERLRLNAGIEIAAEDEGTSDPMQRTGETRDTRLQ
jgi:DNA anti-recombination protein RmuC